MAKLSDRIKSLRLSANMTQEEFGKKFGIVKSTVSLYESGKSTPNDETKKQICDYFHVSIDYLLGNDAFCNLPSVREEKNNFFSFDSVLREIFTSRIKSTLRDFEITEDEFKNQIPIGKVKATMLLEGNADPTANDLIEISQFLETTIDYLLGQVPKISYVEKKLLNTFVKLNDDCKDIIIGKTKELLMEQERSNVAADEQLKKTGTDALGK